MVYILYYQNGYNVDDNVVLIKVLYILIKIDNHF